jgi:hypothetical protein
MLYVRLGDINLAAKQVMSITGATHVAANPANPTVSERNTPGN